MNDWGGQDGEPRNLTPKLRLLLLSLWLWKVLQASLDLQSWKFWPQEPR